MDNFDYQAYLKNNPLLKEDARTDAEQEGYKDGFDDAKADIKNSLSKMKVSEFKEKIRTEILSTLSEESTLEESETIYYYGSDGRCYRADDEGNRDVVSDSYCRQYAGQGVREESQYEASLYSEAEIDEEVERFLKEADEEVDVEVDGDNIDIEDKGVDATVEVGLSKEEKIVQDSLQAAMEAANSLGNQKLADQIGNTITFFTREYVVGRNSD